MDAVALAFVKRVYINFARREPACLSKVINGPINICFCFFGIVPKGEDLEVVWILLVRKRAEEKQVRENPIRWIVALPSGVKPNDILWEPTE